MESPEAPKKKMTKQSTGISEYEDTPLHFAVRAGDLNAVKEILTRTSQEELADLLPRKSLRGETALYVASECGYVDLVKELIKYYNIASAEIKARSGFDAIQIAAKEGKLGMFCFYQISDQQPYLKLPCLYVYIYM